MTESETATPQCKDQSLETRFRLIPFTVPILSVTPVQPNSCVTCAISQHVRLLTEAAVEQFFARIFLRNPPLRSLTIVSPFVNTMADCRYSLADLSARITAQRTPTYFVTREPVELWHQEAVDFLSKNSWVEIRYNDLLHAKVFIASAVQESESFAVFGSGNLTGAAVNDNLEVGMILLARGHGRKLVDELYYWATNSLRVLPESRLIKPMHAAKK